MIKKYLIVTVFLFFIFGSKIAFGYDITNYPSSTQFSAVLVGPNTTSAIGGTTSTKTLIGYALYPAGGAGNKTTIASATSSVSLMCGTTIFRYALSGYIDPNNGGTGNFIYAVCASGNAIILENYSPHNWTGSVYYLPFDYRVSSSSMEQATESLAWWTIYLIQGVIVLLLIGFIAWIIKR